MSNLDHDVAGLDFIAVKIGDVNGSAIANSNDTDTESRSTVVLNATNAIRNMLKGSIHRF